MRKNVLIGASLIVLGAVGAYVYLAATRPSPGIGTTTQERAGEFCVKHQIAEKDCPWCDSSLIEKRGQCSAHGVPEALCTKCNADLIAGFKAEGDWCGGHSVPESQCTICGGSCASGQSPAPAESE